MSIETVPGTLRGYRAWRVVWHGGQERRHGPWCDTAAEPFHLHPIANHRSQLQMWEGIQAAAFCALEEQRWAVLGSQSYLNPLDQNNYHPAPCWNCTCGIYARYRNLDDFSRLSLVGSIRAFGRIVMQEQGFRSQFAKVEALALGSAWRADMPWHALQLFGQVHNIPVFHSLAELQERFPPEDVSRWIEPRKNAIQDAYLYGAMLTGTDLEEFKRSAMNAWPAEKYRRFD